MFVDVFPVRLYVPAIKIPLSVKVKAIPYANLYVPRILLVEPGQGRSYVNEFLRTNYGWRWLLGETVIGDM